MTTESKEFALYKAEQMVNEVDGTLLYLTIFGSTLYGTAREGKSDFDVKGIYLPSVTSSILQNVQHCLSFSTGNQKTKNTSEDIDIQIWSLQKFLLELLPKGDTNALDLLYSHTNKNCVLMIDPKMNTIFTKCNDFISAKNIEGCVGYAINQAKKYGLKGTRLGTLMGIRDWISQHSEIEDDTQLYIFAKEIADLFPKGCKIISNKNDLFLSINGKLFNFHIKFNIFKERIEQEVLKYGERAIQAMHNEGIDWKALSHAVRGIRQIQILYDKGKIEYPLSCAKELTKIKEGKLPWSEVEEIILSGLDNVKTLSINLHDKFDTYNSKIAQDCITSMYNISTASSVIPTVRDTILKELNIIEERHNVKILFAVESGSRAWGFASDDSDYDVRFVYVHKKDWYLNLYGNSKDVIELPVYNCNDYKLDINGWDIRKVLSLLIAGNNTPIEWVHSPTYKYINDTTIETLKNICCIMFNPCKSWNHYKGLFLYASKEYTQKQFIKSYAYKLRALLSALYIQTYNTMIPSVSILKLIDSSHLTSNEKQLLNNFVYEKRYNTEKDIWHPSSELDDLVTKLTANLQSPKSNNLNYEYNKEYANNMFKHIVQETWKN